MKYFFVVGLNMTATGYELIAATMVRVAMPISPRREESIVCHVYFSHNNNNNYYYYSLCSKTLADLSVEVR